MQKMGHFHIFQQRNEFTTQLLMNNNLRTPYKATGVRGAAVGWGTALQTGRSWVQFPMESLEFFSNLILLVALWL
jgi:hypothetical protein